MHLYKKQSILSGRRERAVNRVRSKITGTAARPRLSVYRSLTSLSAQLIDDTAQRTVVAVMPAELKGKKMTKTEQAQALGKILAEKAKEKKISEAVFDRRWYKFHGRIKAFADAAREGGLKF